MFTRLLEPVHNGLFMVLVFISEDIQMARKDLYTKETFVQELFC